MFFSIEDVAGTILGRGGNLDAEMYSQKEKRVGGVQAYVFDYRIKDKHLLTVFGIQQVCVCLSFMRACVLA